MDTIKSSDILSDILKTCTESHILNNKASPYNMLLISHLSKIIKPSGLTKSNIYVNMFGKRHRSLKTNNVEPRDNQLSSIRESEQFARNTI